VEKITITFSYTTVPYCADSEESPDSTTLYSWLFITIIILLIYILDVLYFYFNLSSTGCKCISVFLLPWWRVLVW